MYIFFNKVIMLGILLGIFSPLALNSLYVDKINSNTTSIKRLENLTTKLADFKVDGSKWIYIDVKEMVYIDNNRLVYLDINKKEQEVLIENEIEISNISGILFKTIGIRDGKEVVSAKNIEYYLNYASKD